MREFEENELLLDSMLFRLIKIQENTKKLSDAYKMKNNNIPWSDISGLRNIIVHDYGNVDLGVFYYTLKEDIPSLINEFR